MKSCAWQLHYDKDINQYYYYNTKDNTVSFDSPQEVVKTQKKSILRKFSFKRKKSNDSVCTLDRSSSSSSLNSFDDEFLLNNSNNFKNFAGTSLYEDDDASINSEQSIITYYSNLDTDYSKDYHSFDKEKERIELRLQFLKEIA